MKKLIPSLLLTLGVGALAGVITAGESSGEWYLNLAKPSYQLPSWLFSPVWTSLYILMGISFYKVWKKPLSRERNIAVTLFLVQLLLNFLWSILFFSLHSPGLALIDIVMMWIAILLTIFSFARLSKTAAWLLVPYIMWVSFATILNWDIWRMNS